MWWVSLEGYSWCLVGDGMKMKTMMKVQMMPGASQAITLTFGRKSDLELGGSGCSLGRLFLKRRDGRIGGRLDGSCCSSSLNGLPRSTSG